jgi:hypothetical protein
MIPSHRSLRKRWQRALVAVCLSAALVLLLWNRHRSGNTALPGKPLLTATQHAVAPDAPAAPAVESSVSPASATGAPPRLVPESSAAAPAPDYGSEAFIHVPAWLPRPSKAFSASAEDASLRSDGYVEGTVRLVFLEEEHAAALREITAHLEAAGMAAGADGKVHASTNPPRQCTVHVATMPGGGMAVNLSYQGTDHDKGCLCPTCGGAADQANP